MGQQVQGETGWEGVGVEGTGSVKQVTGPGGQAERDCGDVGHTAIAVLNNLPHSNTHTFSRKTISASAHNQQQHSPFQSICRRDDGRLLCRRFQGRTQGITNRWYVVLVFSRMVIVLLMHSHQIPPTHPNRSLAPSESATVHQEAREHVSPFG